jgi:enamine deaminase RidA (YjgF/YER057c/UK114 family)
VSPDAAAKTIEALGCSIVLRRLEGAEARELFFSCQPPKTSTDAGEQADAVYRAIVGVLKDEGTSFRSVVSETLFLRNRESDLEQVRAARAGVLAECESSPHRPARTEIEQPPLNEGARLEVLIQAVVPNHHPLRVDTFEAITNCSCAECARSHGLVVGVGEETRLYAGGLYGLGDDSYKQTHAMFDVADKLLQRAGMAFRDVMRTWIYLPEMERDYPGFNQARREFFEARGINPVPASTGIGAGLIPAKHDICLGLYAVRSDPLPPRIVMTTPTLNEAPEYGSDFSRGMRVEETNKISLLVSGTASIDETGSTVHVGDFEAQVDRMLVNVAALLEGQGASFDDVVSAITYVKHPEDAGRLREKFHEAGYKGFPNVLVAAEVCRPELLCETELLAVLPVHGERLISK